MVVVGWRQAAHPLSMQIISIEYNDGYYDDTRAIDINRF